MSKVTLINSFEVPEGQEGECLQYWEQANEYMRTQPGFISTKLHKALSPETRFHFVNIAEWESAECFFTAVSSDSFKQITDPKKDLFPHYPGLYQVIRTE